ncbi:MAG: hypothetical protein WC545_03420 [Patescibacteria group bacterium]
MNNDLEKFNLTNKPKEPSSELSLEDGIDDHEKESDSEKMEQKPQNDLRVKNINNEIDRNFSRSENYEEISRVTDKAVQIIESLPAEKKEEKWQEFEKLIGAGADPYYFKEFHDSLLEYRKTLKTESKLVDKDIPIEDRINEAKSFEDLELILDKSDGLIGSNNEFSSSELKKIISDVREFKIPIDAVTRTGGLRSKVLGLLAEPESNKATMRAEVVTPQGSQTWETQYTPNREIIRLNRGRGWEIVNSEDLQNIYKEVKSLEMDQDIDAWRLYQNELGKISAVGSPNVGEIGNKMNALKKSWEDKFLYKPQSLDEIKANLVMLYNKIKTPAYAELIKFIDEDEATTAEMMKRIESAGTGGKPSLIEKIARLRKIL